MKKLNLVLILISFSVLVYSQKLKWVNLSQAYIDLVDKGQNVYIGAEPYGVQDIDPGNEIVNIDVNGVGAFFVKYDSSFNIEWYKTSAQPDLCYQHTIMTCDDNNDLYLLIDKNRNFSVNGSTYYISKFSDDGILEFEKKAFYLELGFGGVYSDFFDISIDSSSNIWVSGLVKGKVSFGENGANHNFPDAIFFIAKYDGSGNCMQVILREPNKYFGLNYNRTNFKISKNGTTHQLILENNSYSYLSIDTLNNETKTILVDSKNSKVIPSHLILTDSGFYTIGTFSDAFDIDNSENIKYLSPKGSIDIFIAKYDNSAKMLDAWQIGGSGSLMLTENVIIRNDKLIITLGSNGFSVVDFLIGPGTFEVELNNNMANVCYDLLIYNNDIDTSSVSNDDLVADIAPGADGSYPMFLVNFKDTLFFIADDGKTGNELWKSDGTAKGTVLVKDLNSSGDSFHPAFSYFSRFPIIAGSNYLFVTPDTLSNLSTLWVTKGDSLSFVQISDSLAYFKILLNDTLIAQKKDGSYLFSDGTENGLMTKTLDTDKPYLDFLNILNKDSIIYYYSYTWDSDYLFVSSEIYSFDGESFVKICTLGFPIYGLEIFDGRFFFYEFYKSFNIVPNKLSSINMEGKDYKVVCSFPDNLVRTDEANFILKNIGNKLLFLGYDNKNKQELWVTDGTADNTHLLKNLNSSGILTINNFELSNNNVLFFSADDGHGMDIFQTDGTSDGTLRLRGLSPFGNVNYNSMAIVNDILFFGATNNEKGCELWKYKFINEIDIQDENHIFSIDSSQITVNLDVEILPFDATDKSVTYSLIDSAVFSAEIDTSGEIVLTRKSSRKSTEIKDTLKILVQATDGSKKSTVYNLVLNPDALNVKNEILDFQVWPNPTNDRLYIKSDSESIGKIIITDILGRIVFQESFDNMNFATIDLSSVPKGLLHLKRQSVNNITIKILHQ